MSLIGKTIESITKAKHPYYDDKGFLVIHFTDGSQCTILASYDGYTGGSYGEYPTDIAVHEGEYLLDDSCDYSAGKGEKLPVTPISESPLTGCFRLAH